MTSRVQTSSGDLSQVLKQAGGRIVKAVNDAMMAEMKNVQQEAIARAPMDEGNLEDAIKLTSENRRRTWTVYVDESMPDDTGKYTVGDYATWLHEAQYNLGEKSLDKAASNGKPVGRKYLEGAFEEAIQDGMVDRLAALAKAYGIK